MRRASWIPLSFLAVAGCARIDWGPEQLGEGHTSTADRTAELGREVYGQYCVGCHGEEGDGAGPAARFLDPKPRDFRVGKLKFAGVTSGEPPRDDDYLATLDHGLRGTAMPSFALLTLQERRAVVAYIREFVPSKKRKVPGAQLAIPEDPWSKDEAGGVAEGKRVYHSVARCWTCHPAYAKDAEITSYYLSANLPAPEMRKNPSEPVPTESTWGAPIRPPDFLMDRVKTGIEAATLVRVIQAGVGGTAMPTWAGALKPGELWGLAYYVRSLAIERGTPEIVASRRLAPPKEKVTP